MQSLKVASGLDQFRATILCHFLKERAPVAYVVLLTTTADPQDRRMSECQIEQQTI